MQLQRSADMRTKMLVRLVFFTESQTLGVIEITSDSAF